MMIDTQFIASVDKYISNHGNNSSTNFNEPLRLFAMKYTEPTAFEATVYEPVTCMILQGAKEAVFDGKTCRSEAGQSFIVSHNLPIISRITKASEQEPYLALVVPIDLSILLSLHGQIIGHGVSTSEVTSLGMQKADDDFIDAMRRYFMLSQDETEANVMGPLILKELHFRLLRARHGGMLRQLLNRDSHASRISKAIAEIKKSFKTQIAINDLANIAGMSASSFHEHFKSITATSPLQYQKELRLMEARRLIAQGDISISSAAFEVGYESPTQFTREYTRKFGASPRNDLGRIVIMV
ncbi:AraC family transcriptional regulator [Lentilitoribacter sp. Alg239-R112]|uniref:AraC family transcriptional regulator n=1 Tax=Lentilitoribacter sp. Alg239-R112 TaxID=2305987 RepID=UPI0013A6EBC7|nr:AraC family transcriptional regulator [Lentilitoribacter sp. Alg239-R112]